MIRFFFLFAFMVTGVVSLSVGVHAQNSGVNEQTAFYANPKYNSMVRIARASMPDNFRFTEFRRFYAETRQYDPVGETIVKELMALAYAAETQEDESEAQKAFAAYRDFVDDHLAHLQVVMYALSFAKKDARYGDVQFLTWLRNGLINDVMISGDGNTLRGAYDVITFYEETALLGNLGVKVLETLSRAEGYYRYNMHEVEDLKTGRVYTVFVNTTFPVKFLETLDSSQEKRFDLRRQ